MDVLDFLIPALAIFAAILVPLARRLASRKTAPALIGAITRGDAKVVKKLVTRGALVDATDDLLDRTPLIIATMSGNAEIVAILLAGGARVNAVDMEGWTAMRYANGFGYTHIAELLARAGAKE
jgi:ankyrin repeat protein